VPGDTAGLFQHSQVPGHSGLGQRQHVHDVAGDTASVRYQILHDLEPDRIGQSVEQGDHAFLIFVPLLPVYAIELGGPEFLMITQSVATALAALALYLLGRDRLGSVPAALVGLAYLAFFVNQILALALFKLLNGILMLLY